MNVAVAGLWHLGTVTSACLASSGHDVIAYDDNAEVVEGLRRMCLPVGETGLESLMGSAINQGRLSFTTEAEQLEKADVLWVCYDTPVGEDDVADVDFVCRRIISLLPYLRDHTLVLISSQLPVGTTAYLETQCLKVLAHKELSFAYTPENLRLGTAIEVFTRPDRVVAGVRTLADRDRISALLQPFTDRIEWMSVESAEMTKHALNAFLATSVAYINEIAMLCEIVGADAQEIERGLKSDSRIGERAYLHAGNAFAGGTLARDIAFLLDISQRRQVPAQLLAGVEHSNQLHKGWVRRRLGEVFGELAGTTVAILGLTYKPGTNTLRRSGAIETALWLHGRGASVQAFDPVVTEVPEDFSDLISLRRCLGDALDSADALIVATPWPDFLELSANEVIEKMRRPIVFDPGRHLERNLAADSRISYFAVGRDSSTIRNVSQGLPD